MYMQRSTDFYSVSESSSVVIAMPVSPQAIVTQSAVDPNDLKLKPWVHVLAKQFHSQNNSNNDYYDYYARVH